ncbi:MAG: response regulator [Bacillota bacterium]
MYKVMAVDDSPTVLASIKLALERRGYDLHTSQRAEEALKQLNSEKADLVITDLNMPGMDGITFIKQVRANAVYRFTPIVMLTTESQQAKKEEARKAGATAWITKPFTPDQLEMVLKKLLR